MMRKSFLIISLFCTIAALAQQLKVIPQPVSVKWENGYCAPEKAEPKVTILQTMPQKDGYILSINKKGVSITAQSNAGVQYANETLRQIRAQYRSSDPLPALTIHDWPRYEWRGLMLDCSRHFYTLEYLKRTVDMLARYKMNRLHLHLTDDQGWRIEIKRYPELTQQGAWREFNQQDSICMRDYADQPEFHLDSRFIIHHGDKTLYGGYYSQEQLRDLVAYASERNVEIIPEIDMPGHTQAISAIHPEFTATGEAQWGTVFSVPLSPAKEEVYEYLQNILDEVMDIFPSRYIHIGADEVEKDTWKKSEACKALMEREGIETYEALQSYFVKRIHTYIKSKGREMICWDDAMEGGLDSDADVMYWRYWVGGVAKKAVEAGHHIIFTPGSPMYIAHPEGPLYDIYHFEGLDNIPTELEHLVRGGQVSLWGESMSSYRRADYCIYPRLLALAERLWTPGEERNWKSFKQRLDVEKRWLEAHDILYTKTISQLTAMQKTDLDNKQLLLTFDSEFSDPDIRYTLDGSTPTASSAKYNDEPLRITSPVDVVAAIMNDGQPQEPMFRRHLEYHKAVGAKVEFLSGRWYESYKAAELATFTDGKRGVETGFGDGVWQGFLGSFEFVVDLGETTSLNTIAMRFLQDAGPGVYMPGSVEFALSEDGVDYCHPIVIENDIPANKKGVIVKDFTIANLPTALNKAEAKARFVKVKVNNTQSGFVFADELVIN